MPCFERVKRGTLSCVTLATLAACNDSTGNSGSIQLSLSSVGVSVTQGGSGTTSVTITRAGGFAGVVSLSVTGLPPGVGVGFSPAQLSATEVGSTINVTVAPTAVPGTFNATINATGAGVTAGSVNLELTISQAPDFRISLTNTALSITAGQSGNTTVNVERTNYAGVITLALVNAPAGVTASFSPTTVSANSTVITITVGPAVTPATYPLQIEGVGTGVGSRVTTLMLTVQPQLASFSINVSPTAFTLPRGNTTVLNITLSRTDYTGPVTLTFENPPAGITGTITPATTTGNTATFNISVGDNVAPAGYQLRIKGTAPGFIDRVAFVQITVTVPVGGDVEYLYCSAAEAPVFFAYQDGSGPWKQVTPTTTGVFIKFAFTLLQARGGVLAVHHTSVPLVADALNHVRQRPVTKPRGLHARIASKSARALALIDQYQTDVAYATVAELAQDGIDNCRQTLGTRSVTGAVSGINPPEVAVVSLGNATNVFFGGVTTNPVTFDGVQEGTVDLVASRMPAAGNSPDRLVIMRGLDIPDGGAIPSAIDFTGPSSSPAATATASITGSGTDLLEMFTDVVTANGSASLWFDLVPSANSLRPWGGLSLATMIAGDLHGLAVFATPAAGTAGDFRVTLRYVGAVADQALAMGPVLNAPTATQVAAGSYPRFRFQGSVQSEYNKGVSVDIQAADGSGNTYSIIATSGWLTAAGNVLAYDLTMPDVSALPGFPAAARLTAGPNDAAVSAFGFTGQGIFDLRPTLGTEFKAASRGVGIVVP